MKICGIIPARYASTRFPGKPLVSIHGKSMIQRVCEQVAKVPALSAFAVATDDDRIAEHVRSFGAAVVMTSPKHPSGTDRCLEALTTLAWEADAVVNIQGDEPFVDPSQIGALCELVQRDGVDIATLAKQIHDSAVLFDPNKVKAVFNHETGRALYFSRQALPHIKGVAADQWLEHYKYYKHIGLYAYKTSTLKQLVNLSPSPLELAESLEQLRWLEHGFSIFVAPTTIETPAVDTPADLEQILANPIPGLD